MLAKARYAVTLTSGVPGENARSRPSAVANTNWRCRRASMSPPPSKIPTVGQLTVTVSVLPGGLSDDSSGHITGTVDYQAVETNHGRYTVTVTATDDHKVTISAEFASTITDTNRPPVIDLDPITSPPSAVGSKVDLAPTVTDPDSDPITITIKGLPAGLFRRQLRSHHRDHRLSGPPNQSGPLHRYPHRHRQPQGRDHDHFAWTVSSR
jgi:hypothetical protein